MKIHLKNNDDLISLAKLLNAGFTLSLPSPVIKIRESGKVDVFVSLSSNALMIGGEEIDFSEFIKKDIIESDIHEILKPILEIIKDAPVMCKINKNGKIVFVEESFLLDNLDLITKVLTL